jgi:hypothetical protein
MARQHSVLAGAILALTVWFEIGAQSRNVETARARDPGRELQNRTAPEATDIVVAGNRPIAREQHIEPG